MTLNEFVLALMAVVIGLGLSDLLSSLHRLLRAGSRVKWDWLTLLYAAYMIYSTIVFWWWQFGYPGDGTTLTIAQFLPSFVFLALAYLMVASALPDEVPAEGLSLREFYLGTVVHRWGLLTLALGLNLMAGVMNMIESQTFYVVGLFVGGCVVLSALAIRFRASWFHALVLVYLFGVTSYANLFRPIGP